MPHCRTAPRLGTAMTLTMAARCQQDGKERASVRPCTRAMRGWALIAAIFFVAGIAQAGPAVVVSLKPIHSLVENVMRGVGEPALLVPDGPLPDGYLISQTARAALREADIIVWLGQPADAGLAAAIAGRKTSARLITLAAVPGVAIAPLPIEPHAWLDAHNAMAMAEAIASTLSEADPANANTYRNNAAALLMALERLDANLRTDLARLGNTPFLVYEDAFSLFTRRYHLAGALPVVIDPSLRRHLGGIDTARLLSLRADWRKRGMRCLFHEPQVERGFVRLLADDTNITVMPLDPYGTGLPAGARLYDELMRKFRDTIVRCAVDAP